MIPIFPFYNSRPMFMLMNPRMIGVPTASVVYPPNNINMCSSTTMTNKYDSHMYGRFRHVGRDHPRYRHAPFDWYQPPKQRYNIVHEDAAVITRDGPVPIGDFYRYYIYKEGMNDSDYYDDSTSYESKESSYEQSIGYRRNSRRQSDFDDEQEENIRLPSNRPSIRTNNYTTLKPNRD